nr:MAG TPA: hypothetical protein [Caudoviricetes sp.]
MFTCNGLSTGMKSSKKTQKMPLPISCPFIIY